MFVSQAGSLLLHPLLASLSGMEKKTEGFPAHCSLALVHCPVRKFSEALAEVAQSQAEALRRTARKRLANVLCEPRRMPG